MEKHTVIFTALPNGRAADGALRLSVHIAPRLWSSDATIEKLKLSQFPDFVDWTAKVAAATWKVSFAGGPTLEATVESAAPRADLWSALFRPETDVTPYRFDDYRGAEIVTFSSAEIHDFLSGVYARAASDPPYGAGRDLPAIELLARDPNIGGIARPTTPETPPDPPRRPPPVDLGGKLPQPEPTPSPGGGGPGCGCGCLLLPLALLARLCPRLQAIFDRLFGGGAPPSRPDEGPAYPSVPIPASPPAAPPNAVSSPPPPPAPPPVPVSPARQAFEKLSAFTTPPSLVAEPLPTVLALQQQYDFHQMIAALGDYPKLLRMFGLVVDLRVELNGAAPAGEGRVQVEPEIALSVMGTEIKPRTHYTLTADSFIARPRPTNPEIKNGLLRLHDSSLFRVIQVDVVGGGTKVQNAATNLVAFQRKEDRSPNMPDNSGLPALRTAGISVVRQNLPEELRSQFRRSHALQQFVALADLAPQPVDPPGAEPALPSTDEVFAEDLVRGYRIDVWDAKSGAWHSLCRRIGTYEFLDAPAAPGGSVLLTEEDEGFVQFSAAEPIKKRAKRQLRTSDALFAWDGWSLVAPRPGQVIMPNEPPDAPEDVKLAKPKNSAVTNFKLETEFRAKPGSLPRLRFDYRYRIRARVCDLAGNSVFGPDDPQFAADVPEQTPEFPCARYEPVAPPPLMLRKNVVEGESVEHLVVRTPPLDGSDTTERHVVPPKISQLMAEQHGKFDGVKIDSTPAAYALAGREAGALNDGATEVKKDIWVQPAPQFTMKYLPDPSSRGAALLGLPGAGAAAPQRVPFDGGWPDPLPFRLRLVGIPKGAAPAAPLWDNATRVLTVELPEAEKALVRLNSVLDAADLEQQGVWQWTQAQTPAAALATVQADTLAGRSWLQLPWRDLTLVHAVLQPLEPPQANVDTPADRTLGKTFATIKGTVVAHAASTGKVDLLGAWVDPIDDPALPAPTTREQTTPLCEVMIEEEQNVTPIRDSVENKLPNHNFGDTKFHEVRYTPIATTRFREYFPPPDRDDPLKTSLAGAPSGAVEILNSARPEAPKVLYVVPTFGWSEQSTGANQKERKRHGGGLRVYLDRPWYSSGAGELLGVVFLEGQIFTDLDEQTKAVVTQWGADPIWLSGPANASASVNHFKGHVAKQVGLSLAEKAPPVSVVGFAVEFDPVRKLWFCDLDLNVGATYAPFVRLALARYQPKSLEGAHLSRVVRAEFAQLAPDRTASVATNATASGAKIRVRVTGDTYIASSLTNISGSHDPVFGGKDSGRIGHAEIEVLLQRRNASLGDDPHLSWETLSTTRLVQDPSKLGEWEGEVELTQPLAAGEFRVLLQEYEWYRADYQPEEAQRGITANRRMVYADAFRLN
ncbi:MAG: hypothetical protein H0V56_13905 [Chthoniobacterales bacterium]|nr:hypothetical protein [Chthoniobacterales bacterium]